MEEPKKCPQCGKPAAEVYKLDTQGGRLPRGPYCSERCEEVTRGLSRYEGFNS